MYNLFNFQLSKRTPIMLELKKPYQLTNKWLQMLLVALLLIVSVTISFSQVSDSVQTDSIPKRPVIKDGHSPKKAAIMSAIIPGAGQIYNKKYWKVPIIYAGIAGLGYSFNLNESKYLQYRNAYKARLDNDPSTVDNFPKYSDGDLNTLQKYYHRFRDLSVIGATLLYVMNIVDASVDAHLFNFSVDDDDLSFNLQPTLINTAALNQYATGLTLKIRF
jgi:hypothetical protein